MGNQYQTLGTFQDLLLSPVSLPRFFLSEGFQLTKRKNYHQWKSFKSGIENSKNSKIKSSMYFI